MDVIKSPKSSRMANLIAKQRHDDSNTNLDPQSPQQMQILYDGLSRQLKDQGSIGMDNVEIRQFSAGYRSVYASKQVSINDTLLLIPRSCFITIDYALGNVDTEKYFNFEQDYDIVRLQSEFAQLDHKTIFVIYLIQEYFKYDKSDWYYFIHTLPQDYEKYTPLYFHYDGKQTNKSKTNPKREKYLEMLKGTYLMDMLNDQYDKIKYNYQILLKYLKTDKYIKANIFTFDMWLWANCVVMSRTWEIKGECNDEHLLTPQLRNIYAKYESMADIIDENPNIDHDMHVNSVKDIVETINTLRPKCTNETDRFSGELMTYREIESLIPFADMFNHQTSTIKQTHWGYDRDVHGWRLRMKYKGAHIGDELYLGYGRKHCNHRFFVEYGFVVENNTDADMHNPNCHVTSIEFDRVVEFRITKLWRYRGTSRCFRYLNEKYHGIKHTNLDATKYGDIMNIDNEIALLNELKNAVTTKEESMTSTVEKDEQYLKDYASYPLYSVERNIVHLRLNELRVLRFYQFMIDKCLFLLDKIKKSENKRLSSDDKAMVRSIIAENKYFGAFVDHIVAPFNNI